MGKCSICNKNEAILYIKKIEQNKVTMDGICLACAYRNGIGGMEKFFEQNGINEDNVDEFSSMLNNVVKNMSGKSPQELLEMISTHLPEEFPTDITENIDDIMQAFTNGLAIDGNDNSNDAAGEADNKNKAVGQKDETRSNQQLQHWTPAGEMSEKADNANGAANGDPANDGGASAGTGAGTETGAGAETGAGDEDKDADKKVPPKFNGQSIQFILPGKQSGQNEDDAEDENTSNDDNNHSGTPFQELLNGLRGFFIADENGFQGLMPVARGGDTDDEEKTSSDKNRKNRRNDKTGGRKKRKFLEQFGTNLNQKAAEGKIDRMIGRTKELERVVQILNRRNKNNPVLLGEPGVGKTAIAEGLAMRIVAGEVPPKLQNMEVYLLDMTGMVAGTQFRGQFESRMKGVVDEASADGNIILVIDELHNIMGAGDAEGAMNAANILKPALAKGAIRVLGSTTLSEYRRFVEKDTALERRFQQVLVEEPSAEDTFAILQGVRDYYEQHHNVRYSDEVLHTAVRYAGRYINERFFPDKAIDIIDEAGAKANLKQKELVQAAKLKDKIAELGQKLSETERQISEAGNLSESESNELYEKKAKFTAEKLQTEEELKSLQPLLQPVEITNEDIAAVVEMWTGIPVKSITESETEKLINLESRLHQRVIGQNEAIAVLSKAVRRSRAGFGRRNKPASFIFVGPTGVGKTELVKAMTEVLFDDEKAMIRMDMSEFMEAHTVSKIIGSPPGYVGYDDGGQLTEKVRRHPYSVILLDEIEKAHADVFNILLQILDDGRLTDSHGKLVSFENTIIIMTSNAGTSNQSGGYGFGRHNQEAMSEKVHRVLSEIFRPEFLNRVDEIVVFNSLTPAELRQIIDIMLREVAANLQRIGVKLEVTDAAKDYIVEHGYSPKYGARPLRKAIRRLLEDPLADDYLRGTLRGIAKVAIDAQDNQLQIKKI